MTTSGVLDAEPPRFTSADAEAIARDAFGVSGTAEPLVSERDQNFLLASPDGNAWVLKVSNAAEERAVVVMEVAAVERVAAVDSGLPVPVARRALEGEPLSTVRGADGAEHLVRLLPAMPGHHVEPQAMDLSAIREVGSVVARLGRALRGFFHPAAGRVIDRICAAISLNLGL